MELNHAKGTWDEVYNVHNQGIQMLGQIKHGFCHPRAILFKVLADTVSLDCRLMVVRFHVSLFWCFLKMMDLYLQFVNLFMFYVFRVYQRKEKGSEQIHTGMCLL